MPLILILVGGLLFSEEDIDKSYSLRMAVDRKKPDHRQEDSERPLTDSREDNERRCHDACASGCSKLGFYSTNKERGLVKMAVGFGIGCVCWCGSRSDIIRVEWLARERGL